MISLSAVSSLFLWILFINLASGFRKPQTTRVFHTSTRINIHRFDEHTSYICSMKSRGVCEDEIISFVSKREELTRSSFLRSFIQVGSIICTGNVVLPNASLADEERMMKKPYAPLENLLPATRVRVLIDRAVDTAFAMVRLQKDDALSTGGESEKLLVELKRLIFEPQEFMTEEETSSSKRYLEQKTWGDWKKARQKDVQQKYQIEVDPATRANEAFEQWGERRQFKRLRRQQLALEKSNNMRAAFNAYTNNLVFGEGYTLNASKEEKSRLIRSEQLPDVTSVIRSDLDLRDLYRNQILTYIDDSKAELEYQLKSGESFDATELLTLLREAQLSCNEWFNFVPEADAKDALYAVLLES